MRRKSNGISMSGIGAGFCGLQVLAIVAYGIVSTFAFSYVLWIGIGKDVPWYLDLLGGFVTGPLVCTMAIIGYILQVAGVPMPLWG